MSRVTYGTLSLVLIGGLVAALVKAQDNPRSPSSYQPTWHGVSGQKSTAGDQTLLRQFRAVSRTAASEYLAESAGTGNAPRTLIPPRGTAPLRRSSTSQSSTIMVSHESSSDRTLRSVLKRPSSDRDETTDDASELESVATPPALQTPVDEEPEPAPSPPSRIITSSETSPQTTAPPIASSRVSSSPDGRVSSRRTGRTTVPFSTASSISTRRANPPEDTTAAETSTDSNPKTLANVAIPSIRVDTLGPPTVTLGDEATYRILATNQSDETAESLTVTVSVPASVTIVSADSSDGRASVDSASVGAGRVVLDVERLAGRAAASLTLRLLPKSNQPFELATSWSLQPPPSSARIEVLQPLLQLAVSGPSELVYGDTDIYTIELSNPGTGDAKNVSIQVTMGDETSDKLVVGTIPADARKSFDVEVTARQAGPMQIAAAATADHDLQAKGEHQLIVRRANLQLQAVGPGMRYAGTLGDYAVRIANTGDSTAYGVRTEVRLPTGVQYERGLDNARLEDDVLIWQVGDMAPGTHKDYRFQCDLSADGDMKLRFDAKCTDGLEAGAEVTTKVEAIADLTLAVNDPKGPIPVGEDVTYEIEISNRGTEAATEVVSLGQFSEGIEPISAAGMTAEITTGQVVFAPIARIAPGETVKLTVKARAETGGNHIFRASVQCSDPETRLIAEDTTRYYGREVESQLDAPAGASPGGENTPSPAQALQGDTGDWR